jgi:hypothetical protein
VPVARIDGAIGRAAIDSSGPARPTLLRPLMITCPVTGFATDTGFEASDVPVLGTSRQVLVDCLECGQDHPWHIDDLVLDR